MDLFDMLDRILGDDPFVCPACKNSIAIIEIKCECKEVMKFCLACVVASHENQDLFVRELEAHGRKCETAGRAIANSKFREGTDTHNAYCDCDDCVERNRK